MRSLVWLELSLLLSSLSQEIEILISVPGSDREAVSPVLEQDYQFIWVHCDRDGDCPTEEPGFKCVQGLCCPLALARCTGPNPWTVLHLSQKRRL